MIRMPQLVVIALLSLLSPSARAEEQAATEDKIEIKKEYYDTGELRRETPFKNGRIEGTRIWYYRSGKVHIRSEFREGKLNGESTEFHENGLLRRTEEYVDGAQEGPCFAYYESGAFKNSCVYRNGRIVEGTLNGTVEIDKRYSDGIGRDLTVTQYKDGLRHGINAILS